MTVPEPYTQQFVPRDGERLGIQVYPDPDSDPDSGADQRHDPGPAVVIWPAMGVPARYYRPLAGYLVGAGARVAVADLRGTGASTPVPSRRSRYGLAELVQDVGAVRQALAPWLAGRRTLLLGHSLGGQAVVLHTALAQSGAAAEHCTVDGIALVAVGLPYFRSYPARQAATVLPFTQGIAATTALLRVWPGWGFGGRQARGVIRDWAYTARHGRYPRLGGVDPGPALAALATPVLAVSVDDDQYTPPATTDHLLRLLPAAPVTREHYHAAAAGDRLDHFRWVRASAALAARIAGFAAGLPERTVGGR